MLAVRADFYARCAAYPTLAKLLGPNHVLVGPMEREELRRAIERPAQRAGLTVEPDLVDALLADVEDEPGALPLLSTALLELWQRRDGRHLLHATYERTGGVRGAVARLAEEAFGQLDPAQQAVARTVLLRLAGEDTGGAVVRRRVALAELEGASDDDVARVLALLTDRRLLTMSATTVEVAHEALLREWPRLRDWLEEDADGPSRAPPPRGRRARVGRNEDVLPATSTAVPGWRPLSSGVTATSTSSTRPSAPSSTRAGPPPSARSGACAWRSPASRRCW